MEQTVRLHDIQLFDNAGDIVWTGRIEECPYTPKMYEVIYVRYDTKNDKYLTEGRLKPEYELDYEETEY